MWDDIDPVQSTKKHKSTYVKKVYAYRVTTERTGSTVIT